MLPDNSLDILDPRVALLLTVRPENVPLLPPQDDETKQLVPIVIRQYLPDRVEFTGLLFKRRRHSGLAQRQEPFVCVLHRLAAVATWHELILNNQTKCIRSASRPRKSIGPDADARLCAFLRSLPTVC